MTRSALKLTTVGFFYDTSHSMMYKKAVDKRR
jgi:hypothetical protein